MRVLLCAAVLAGAVLCGVSAASAQPNETQAHYLARCRTETLASNPQARSWVDGACAENWTKVEAAGPIADAILGIIPAAPTRIDPAGLRAQMTSVRWGRAQQGSLANGQLGAAAVSITAAELSFSWSETGGLIPYDLVEAFKVRGAAVSMVACSMLGPGEAHQYYTVAAPGHAPFGLMIYTRNAPTANAESFWNAGVDYSARPATLARLRADPNAGDLSPTCPN